MPGIDGIRLPVAHISPSRHHWHVIAIPPSSAFPDHRRRLEAEGVFREIRPGLGLDARRAAWLEESRTLVVADLHLGYAWTHRVRGQLLPVENGDDPVARLGRLIEDYPARELVLLGDIVHGEVRGAALEAEFRRLGELPLQLRLVAGNHDRQLAAWLDRCGFAWPLETEIHLGSNVLLHGEGSDDEDVTDRIVSVGRAGGMHIIGHEHPAISISDGIASRARCPCFLVAPELLVLPAFSSWSAGSTIGTRPLLSPFARAVSFQTAMALLAGKLVPIRIGAGKLSPSAASLRPD
ncbi:MAG: metallophosphoesterase [Chthoniobacteraceae bacterium]